MSKMIFLIGASLLVACTHPTVDRSEVPNYAGKWLEKDEFSEYSLELFTIDQMSQTYRFELYGYERRGAVKYPGGMVDPYFIITIKDGKAFYEDDEHVQVDNHDLYYEGEERCKVFFEFAEDHVDIRTEACEFIRGGAGVKFEGRYFRVKDELGNGRVRTE